MDSSTQVEKSTEQTGVYPARWAHAALMSILLVIGLGYSITGWIAGDKLNIQLTDFQRVVVVFHVFVYMLLSFGAMFGIYVAIVNRARRAHYITPLLLAQLPFSIASGALSLFIVFHASGPQGGDQLPTDFDRCSALMTINPNDGFLREMCERTHLIKGLCIALFIVGWFFQIVATCVSWVYASRLRDVEKASETPLESKFDIDAAYC